jgi:hypothetical protein
MKMAGIRTTKQQEQSEIYLQTKTPAIHLIGNGIILIKTNLILHLLKPQIERMSIKQIETWGIDNEKQ